VNPPFLTDCCDDSKTGIKIQKIGGLVSEGYAVSGDTGRCAEEYVASARNIEGCAAAHKKNVETIVRQAVVSAGLAGGFQIRIELVHGECCMNDKPINNGSADFDRSFCLKTVGFNLGKPIINVVMESPVTKTGCDAEKETVMGERGRYGKREGGRKGD